MPSAEDKIESVPDKTFQARVSRRVCRPRTAIFSLAQCHQKPGRRGAFRPPPVAAPLPACAGLAVHSVLPEVGPEKGVDGSVGGKAAEGRFSDFAKDDPVVVPLGLPGRILVAPLEILAAFPSGHFRRLSNKPYKYITSTLQCCNDCQPVNQIFADF